MSRYDLVKGRPPLRVWELNDNSTRYEKFLAAPSDETLHQMWSAWAGITLVVGVFSLVVFLGILSSRRARSNSFNLYLLFLMFPDIVFSICCGITCTLNAINGEYWSHWMCNFQQFYCVFGIGSNAWLNAVVAHQLYTMLRFSAQRRRYRPPTRTQVSCHAVLVYMFSAFLGTWGLIEKESFPFHSGTRSGLACLPIEVDERSSLFFWLCFFPLFVGIPCVYVAWVSYDVWRRKLLPTTGHRRTLTVYFGRLIVVFVFMWLPTFIILFAAGNWLPPWAHWAGGTWSHLQGAVSAGVSLMKPDIMNAVQTFLVCDQDYEEEGESNDSLKRFKSSFRFASLSKSRYRSSILAVVGRNSTSSAFFSREDVAGSKCVSGESKASQDVENRIVEPSRQASSSSRPSPELELEPVQLHARHNDNGLDYELEDGGASNHSSRNGGLWNPPGAEEDDEETVHA
jgi:hypothetical protein